MTGAVRFVYLLALGAWIGAMVFLSFVVAPTAFAVLGTPQAGDLVGALFPRYYAGGVSLGVTAVAAALFLRLHAARPQAWTAAIVALVIGVGATAWAGGVVHPKARRLRMALQDTSVAATVRDDFARAHRAAVILNGVALMAGLVGLGASAAALRQ